jgi:arabinoxylan arabinofuranohydrolase
MKNFTILSLLILTGSNLFSQNPITPRGVYIADPSAHIWRDGKLYIYGSLDESCDYYCSWRHHVMVTNDMKTWTIHKNSFASKGEGDQVNYNNDLLFAPDCSFRKDTFYLYYCQPGRSAEGVATSTSPTGPFTRGQNLILSGYNQIDPSLFIDDDGQAYYLWGQFTMKMAKMKSNMRELDLSTLRDSIVTENDHHFHEGAFMAKRNGIYYLIYADISRAEMPSCIGYATSKSPFGPYTYGGVIIDNDHCNPGNWNNHGSIAEFKGQWYVFYHRSTHGCNKMRKACVEPIFFNKDGSIPEVEMTSQGASGPLDARSDIDAGWACILQGNVRIQSLTDNVEGLSQIENGDKAAFKYIDFKKGVKSITLRIAPGSSGGKMTLYLDQPWYNKLCEIRIEPENGVKQWKKVTFDVQKVSGVHALWFQFSGKGNDLFSIDWFRFD